jgi:alkanesulfonate monooxygenase SsuD/methylene tetrahydromethanopterin reductase-like flavin-dependent oxidoreductase (luciferase family)
VNPWALPYQKPHPQIWIPGVLSPETVRWCAQHRYPYIGLGTALGPTCDLWDIYAEEAAKLGYQAGPENFGYLIPTFVAETEEKAQELGRGFVYGGGQNAFSRPEHTLPPGYNSKSAIQMLARHPGGSWLGISPDKLRQAQEDEQPETTDYDEVRQKLAASFQKAQKNLQVIIGTPKTVLPKLKTLLQVLRPGVFVFFNVQGPVSNADRMTSMRLIAQEVTPAIREYAKEIDLPDPDERTPGSVTLRTGTSWAPVADRSPLASLGLR